jgi:CRISPR-associated exonuclease Cas4
MMETISISALNQFIFCPRRCALMHVEGIWSDNEHTAKGTILHKTADDSGYETEKGVKLLRALPLFSEKFGLSGKADIVERRGAEIIPVEYKKGKRRQFENDDIQLCAQALCLEEMFETTVARGFIFHAASRRRREVVFDAALKNETIKTIEAVRALLQSETVPAAELKPRCDGCSLYGICLPKLSDPNERRNLEFNPQFEI